MKTRSIGAAKEPLNGGSVRRLVRHWMCRFGIHHLKTIQQSEPSPLIWCLSALTYQECQRCGQVRKWFNSGQWGSYRVGQWASRREIPAHDEFHSLSIHEQR